MQKTIINPSQYNESLATLNQWLTTIQKNRISLYEKISSNIQPNSIAIEIGAGSSWLSALCSQNKNIKHIDVIDIDKRKLMLAEKFFMPQLNATQDKLTFHVSDFHKLDFISSNSIDIVFIDGAMHHSNELIILLTELHRVMNRAGQIIAIREPILPSMPLLKQYKKMSFGREQIKNGDIENIYSKNEWITYFDKCNFNLSFDDLYNNSTKDVFLKLYPLKLMNGLLFNRYYMTAIKK
jgi:ubiquinone/menaquinone biosynthesis C-methylase UbiE